MLSLSLSKELLHEKLSSNENFIVIFLLKKMRYIFNKLDYLFVEIQVKSFTAAVYFKTVVLSVKII